jgi:hypothetical protein
MREMQSSSGSRDDRQKREQQREEKELAKIAQLYPSILNSRIPQDYSMLFLKIFIRNCRLYVELGFP